MELYRPVYDIPMDLYVQCAVIAVPAEKLKNQRRLAQDVLAGV